MAVPIPQGVHMPTLQEQIAGKFLAKLAEYSSLRGDELE
jgi:hypothetical protein